jgi:hypothetical protein
MTADARWTENRHVIHKQWLMGRGSLTLLAALVHPSQVTF